MTDLSSSLILIVLLTLQLLPFAFCLISLQAESSRTAFNIGLAGNWLYLLLIIALILGFDTSEQAQVIQEKLVIFNLLPIRLGIDGLSLLFMLTSAVVSLIAMLYGRERANEMPQRYVSIVLAIQGVLTAQFLTQDLLQYWLLGITESLLLGKLISPLPTRFTPDTQPSVSGHFSTVMTMGWTSFGLAVFILGWHHQQISGDWSFLLSALLKTTGGLKLQTFALLLMAYGIAIRLALFPFHAWLALVLKQHPNLAGPLLILGVKTGVYALFRFVLPLVPEAFTQLSVYFIAIALLGTFYGVTMALMQIHIRRMIAYAATSHSGMIVLGLCALNQKSFAGGALLCANLSIATVGLLYAVGMLHRRCHTNLIPRMGGLYGHMPLISILFLIAALSTMGMPGTPGFDASHLVLEGLLESGNWFYSVGFVICSVMTAGFILWAYQRIFLASRRETRMQITDLALSFVEKVVAMLVCVALLAAGVHSAPWFQLVNAPLQLLGQIYSVER